MRIGVLMGTFDPVHEGDWATAQAALSAGLDRVIFLLGPQKTEAGERFAPSKARIQMCHIACARDARVQVSALLAAKEEMPPLTQTLQKLRHEHKNADLTLLIGADELSGILSNETNEKLSELYDFFCFPCTDARQEEALKAARAAGARVQLLNAPKAAPDMEAKIRAQIAAFEDPDALCGAVAAYIAQNGLYHDDSLSLVRGQMNEKRFMHTLGVRYEAVRLAEMHGISLQKAALAAMLHDCAKGLAYDKMLALAQEAGITDVNLTSSPALLHGPVGAYLARRDYHVGFEDVLNAIAYHTVGRAGMTPLELVIFVADATEPGRDHYPGLKRLRKLSESSLEAAALLSLNLTREYLLKKGKAFNPLSDATAAWLTPRVPDELLFLTSAGTK